MSKKEGRNNIIKHLANNKYKINEITNIGVYKSIARSVIDYNSFCYPLMSLKLKKYLESIQMNCLRTIVKYKYNPDRTNISNKTLLNKLNLDSIEERSKHSFYRYINNCIENRNDLILSLLNDYLELKEINQLNSRRTLLRSYGY